MLVRSSAWKVVAITFTLVAGIGCPGLMGAATADVTPAQRREVNSIKVMVRRAEQRLKQGELNEAAGLVRDTCERMEKLLTDADVDLRTQLKSTYDDFRLLHAELTLEGASLPGLRRLSALLEGKPPGPSFTKSVAPVLVSKCGRCHIGRQEGEFSMRNFEALARGTEAGVVILAGDAEGSRLVEVIESGDMPRGGLKVAAEELEAIKQWIRDGAEYDGDDRQVALTTLAPDVRSAAPPPVPVTAARGDEQVRFSRDLAGVLNEHCAGCHGAGQPVRAALDVTTFRTLLRGGDNGPPVMPGTAADSLLVRKLKGTAEGQRMPQGRPPLADDIIARFETWIDEGARFDARDPTQPMAEIAAIAQAESASHEQLRSARANLALENWRLVYPDDPPQRVDTDHFLLLGNIPAARLTAYGSLAEALVPRIARLFKAPSDTPLIKGGMTFYCFADRYDYGEFGRMVEKRDLPSHLAGHFRFSTVDAYGVLHAADRNEESMEALMAQQLAGNYVSSLGSSPDWFQQGAARASAIRLAPQSPLVADWNQRLGDAFSRLQSVEDLLQGKSTAEDAEVLSSSYVDFLMSDVRRFQKLLAAISAGGEFKVRFADCYGGAPAQIAQAWVRREAGKTQRGGRRRGGR